MTILALDTASAKESIALTCDGAVLFENELPSGRGQSAHLLTNVEGALEKAGLEYKDLKSLMVLTGPGSFTGTRVGISFAKGISMALKIPLYGVHHFALLAEGLKDQGTPVLIGLESGRDEKFFQMCDRGILLGTPINCTWNELPDDFMSDAHAYVADFDIVTDLKSAVVKGYTATRLAGHSQAFKDSLDNVTAYYIRPADTTVKQT